MPNAPSTPPISPAVNCVRAGISDPCRNVSSGARSSGFGSGCGGGTSSNQPWLLRYATRNDSASTAFSGVKKFETLPASSAAWTSWRSTAPIHAASTGFARVLRYRRERLGRCERRNAGARHVQRNDGVDVRIVERELYRVGQSSGRRATADVDQVDTRRILMQQRVELLHRIAGQRAEAKSAIRGRIGGQNAGTASVRHDRNPVSLRNSPARKNPCRGKQLRVRRHAYGTRAAQRGVEHDIGRNLGRRVHRPAGFQHDDRLGARCCSQCGHETASLTDILDIEQDAIGQRIDEHQVEQFAEGDVDCRHRARSPSRSRFQAASRSRGPPSRRRPIARSAPAGPESPMARNRLH